MTAFHTIWLIVAHYGYDAVVEFFVDFGDHFVTHYVLVWVVKAGVVQGAVLVVHKVKRARSGIKTPVKKAKPKQAHKRHRAKK